MSVRRTRPSRRGPLLWLLVLAGIPLLAGCSYVSTAPFQGVVRDASTGEPIPGVFVDCTWRGGQTGLIPVDWTGKLFRVEQTVTDAQGRYEIPAVWFLHVKTLQWFDSGGCSFSHPIYKGTGFGYQWKERIIRESPLYEELYQERVQEGVIRYDIELVPVRLVYTNTSDVNEFFWYLHSQHMDSWSYLKRKYGVRYDVDAIMEIWSDIATNIKPDGMKILEEKKAKIHEIVQEGY